MGGLVSRKFGNLSLSRKEHMKKMEYVKVIGKGSYGKVMLVRMKDDSQR